MLGKPPILSLFATTHEHSCKILYLIFLIEYGPGVNISITNNIKKFAYMQHTTFYQQKILAGKGFRQRNNQVDFLDGY